MRPVLSLLIENALCLAGLAEALRSELLVYGISVHIAFPATIFTPGLDEENKIKPKITLKVEESDGGGAALKRLLPAF